MQNRFQVEYKRRYSNGRLSPSSTTSISADTAGNAASKVKAKALTMPNTTDVIIVEVRGL